MTDPAERTDPPPPTGRPERQPPPGWLDATVMPDMGEGRNWSDGFRLWADLTGLEFKCFDPHPAAPLFNPPLTARYPLPAELPEPRDGQQGDTHDR